MTKLTWTIGRPRSYHAQHYTPIQENIMGSIKTDVCWVLCGGEHANLIAAAPKLLEALKALVHEASMSSIPDDSTPIINAKEAIHDADEQTAKTTTGNND